MLCNEVSIEANRTLSISPLPLNSLENSGMRSSHKLPHTSLRYSPVRQTWAYSMTRRKGQGLAWEAHPRRANTFVSGATEQTARLGPSQRVLAKPGEWATDSLAANSSMEAGRTPNSWTSSQRPKSASQHIPKGSLSLELTRMCKTPPSPDTQMLSQRNSKKERLTDRMVSERAEQRIRSDFGLNSIERLAVFS